MTKFLTKFETPKLWKNRKFSLSVLVGDVEAEVWAVVEGYNISNSLLSTVESGKIFASGKVVRICPAVIYGSLTNVAYLKVTIKSDRIMGGNSLTHTDPLRIDVVEPCDNDFHIWWRNSLGGDSWWNFSFSQDYETVLESAKSERYTLYANNLTLAEMRALDELNSLGEIYNVSYYDYLAATKDKAKTGAQVYRYNTNPVGLVVVEDSVQTRTVRRGHDFSVVIEYPYL